MIQYHMLLSREKVVISPTNQYLRNPQKTVIFVLYL